MLHFRPQLPSTPRSLHCSGAPSPASGVSSWGTPPGSSSERPPNGHQTSAGTSLCRICHRSLRGQRICWTRHVLPYLKDQSLLGAHPLRSLQVCMYYNWSNLVFKTDCANERRWGLKPSQPQEQWQLPPELKGPFQNFAIVYSCNFM